MLQVSWMIWSLGLPVLIDPNGAICNLQSAIEIGTHSPAIPRLGGRCYHGGRDAFFFRRTRQLVEQKVCAGFQFCRLSLPFGYRHMRTFCTEVDEQSCCFFVDPPHCSFGHCVRPCEYSNRRDPALRRCHHGPRSAALTDHAWPRHQPAILTDSYITMCLCSRRIDKG